LWENGSSSDVAPEPAPSAVESSSPDAGVEVLDIEPARVVIKSTPAGLAVAVDGRYLSEATPVTLELEPGKHRVTLSDRGVELWSQDFEVESDTRYVLHPVIQ